MRSIVERQWADVERRDQYEVVMITSGRLRVVTDAA